MEDTAKKFCQTLFDVLQEKGLRKVVCSPGSRNVPLLIAAAARKEMQKYFAVDERTAAFMGLGLSIVSQESVALICTSGTALLNYAPAVAEAYYQNIPLIVISADRPLQWIDQDDSQTLRQDHALANYVKKSYSVPALGEDEGEMLWYVNRIANDAFSEATSGRKGPVHVNIHLAEPLGSRENRIADQTRTVETIMADSIANKEVMKNLAAEVARSKVLVVAGFLRPDAMLQKTLVEFCRKPNIAVMAETISNIHFPPSEYSIDSVLTAYVESTLDDLAPDIVISIGGALVSRKLKEYLRRHKNKIKHWSVGYSLTTTDPFMSLSKRIELPPYRFFRDMNVALRKYSVNNVVSVYKSQWSNLRSAAIEVKERFADDCPWSELKAFDFILKNLPAEYNLFLSNGTAIRYAQIINYAKPHASYCNRGVSGIDGSTSTAVGGALAYKGPTLLLTGDLSFCYDIGALGLRNIPDNFKIIVIDNQGGGIFRFIPSTSSLPELEQYLCQPPLLPLKKLAEAYDWRYFECKDEISLKDNFGNFLSSKGKSIMRVSCDGVLSAEILQSYMKTKV